MDMNDSALTPQDDQSAHDLSLSSPLVPLASKLWFDADNYLVVRRGQHIFLTRREATLLLIFLAAPNRLHT
jgi:DNA-binding response OmpR family regulator